MKKIEIGKIIELLENEVEILSNEAEDYIDVDMYQKAWNTAYENMVDERFPDYVEEHRCQKEGQIFKCAGNCEECPWWEKV